MIRAGVAAATLIGLALGSASADNSVIGAPVPNWSCLQKLRPAIGISAHDWGYLDLKTITLVNSVCQQPELYKDAAYMKCVAHYLKSYKSFRADAEGALALCVNEDTRACFDNAVAKGDDPFAKYVWRICQNPDNPPWGALRECLKSHSVPGHTDEQNERDCALKFTKCQSDYFHAQEHLLDGKAYYSDALNASRILCSVATKSGRACISKYWPRGHALFSELKIDDDFIAANLTDPLTQPSFRDFAAKACAFRDEISQQCAADMLETMLRTPQRYAKIADEFDDAVRKVCLLQAKAAQECRLNALLKGDSDSVFSCASESDRATCRTVLSEWLTNNGTIIVANNQAARDLRKTEAPYPVTYEDIQEACRTANNFDRACIIERMREASPVARDAYAIEERCAIESMSNLSTHLEMNGKIREISGCLDAGTSRTSPEE